MEREKHGDALRRLNVIGGHVVTSSSDAERVEKVLECERAGIRFESSVRTALLSGEPVVALESTILCHGMPYPKNLETAMAVEDIVRAGGALPATIAILEGVPCIGLTSEELGRLARKGHKVAKTARRDVAYVVATKADGATTVSATMLFAAKAGILVFVTGGIGGVHRNGESSMDVSSDLTELGRTPVAVVCAGAKSVLDIGRTLEFLETQGVTVVGLDTDDFPAFFTRTSGFKAPCRLDSPSSCAELIVANQRLRLESGIVVAVPIPSEDAAEARVVDDAIQRALEETRGAVSGNDVTPFLLQRISELTGGASLAANIKLVKNNARIGAQIACVATRRLRERVLSDVQ